MDHFLNVFLHNLEVLLGALAVIIYMLVVFYIFLFGCAAPIKWYWRPLVIVMAILMFIALMTWASINTPIN
jgi:hypothetical protein